jgi:putative DNA primase/helicase
MIVFTKNIPQEIRDLPQWVCWKVEMRDGKEIKVPKNPTSGRNAFSNNPATWATFNEAFDAAKRFGFDGVGFVFSETDPYCGVDLDKCRNPETREIDPWANDIITWLNSYTEISPSGRGVHIWVKGKLPRGSRRKGNIEMYDSRRYFTVTGDHLQGTPTTIESKGKELTVLHRRTFGLEKKERVSPDELALFRDARLVRSLSKAANGEKFDQLWSGDWQGYPSQSEADIAICGFLVSATGKDPARIDRIFRKSKLMRDKWDEPRGEKTYGEITIIKAIANSPEPTPSKALDLPPWIILELKLQLGPSRPREPGGA